MTQIVETYLHLRTTFYTCKFSLPNLFIPNNNNFEKSWKKFLICSTNKISMFSVDWTRFIWQQQRTRRFADYSNLEQLKMRHFSLKWTLLYSDIRINKLHYMTNRSLHKQTRSCLDWSKTGLAGRSSWKYIPLDSDTRKMIILATWWWLRD